MKRAAAVFFCAIAGIANARTTPEPPPPKSGLSTLPVALNHDFEFRKTKLFLCSPVPPNAQVSRYQRFTRGAAAQPEASISFERSYRLFGAVTGLDQRQRFGNYFDFFWRAKRDTPVTIRLEYRQEKLRSFTQARELTYPRGRGSHKTEFAVIGDDFFDDGKVIAWRCLLIADGKIVAEDRSYLWD